MKLNSSERLFVLKLSCFQKYIKDVVMLSYYETML